MNRRQFIGYGAGSFVFGTLPLQSLFAEIRKPGQTPHFFVMIVVEGGMDCTLGLDPRTHLGTDQNDVFLEYREDEIYRRGSLSAGPAAKKLFSKHGPDLLVINGINMRRDAAGHQALVEYICSGSGTGDASHLPVEIGSVFRSGPMGVLVTDGGVNPGARSISLTQITAVNKLFELGDLENEIKELESGLSTRQLGGLKNAELGYLNSLKLILRSRKQMQVGTKLTKQVDPTSVGASLARAMATGLSYQGVVKIFGNLDTHSQHVGNHLRGQTEVWDQVSDILSAYKATPYGSSNLFKHTTFMVVTEFSRTPYLNSAKGKDHNPYTNSVLLAGRGINAGKVVGGSHIIPRSKSPNGQALHFSTPIDFKTGELVSSLDSPNNNVGLIFPENLAATIGDLFDAREDMQTISRRVRSLPGILKI